MEAIAELFAALMMALIGLTAALAELLLTLLFGAAQGLFLVATQDRSKAKERWSESKQHAGEKWNRRRRRKGDVETDKEPVAEGSEPTTEEARSALIGCGVLLLLLVVGGGLYLKFKIDEHRTEEAQALVSRRAKQIAANWGDPPPHVNPQEGMLDDVDPWGNRIELFVDEALLGGMFTVRSAGVDGKTGTIDDVIGIGFRRAKAGEIGKELGDRAIDKAAREFDALQDRLGEKAKDVRALLGEMFKRSDENTESADSDDVSAVESDEALESP